MFIRKLIKAEKPDRKLSKRDFSIEILRCPSKKLNALFLEINKADRAYNLRL